MKHRGFTLIETFVAITILMVAVVGPMLLLSRFIIDASAVKNKIAAAFLAQEGLELVVDRINHNLCIARGSCNNPDGDTLYDWTSGLSACMDEEGGSCEPGEEYSIKPLISFAPCPGEGGFCPVQVNGQTFDRRINVSCPPTGTYVDQYCEINSSVQWVERGSVHPMITLQTVMTYLP